MPNDMTHIDKIQALAFSIGKKMQTELLEQMQATGLTPPQFYILKDFVIIMELQGRQN